MLSLYKDVDSWDNGCLPSSMKTKAKDIFQERWEGYRSGNRRPDIVPLFQPLHMIAFYLDPYLSFFMEGPLPIAASTHATEIFQRYCDYDAKCREKRREFENYCVGVGEYGVGKDVATKDSKATYQELLNNTWKITSAQRVLRHAPKMLSLSALPLALTPLLGGLTTAHTKS